MTEFMPAFSQNNIPVVFVSSNLYAPYAGVFIQSLLDHASAGKNYDIIIFEREISDENKRLLKLFEQGRSNVSIRFYNSELVLKRLAIEESNSPYISDLYCRIIAPLVLLPYERLIAVDTDTLLKRDIADLLAINLEGNCLGGVHDIGWEGWYQSNHFIYMMNQPIRSFLQNIPKWNDPLKFINGALYLFDCTKYREFMTIKKIAEFIRENPKIPSDDILVNIMCDGKIQFIDTAWNVTVKANLHSDYAIKSASVEHQRVYEQALQNPYMLHWAGKPKPWVCPDVPYGNEWWQTALRTPFIGHIIARMSDEQAKRRAYYKKRYGKEDVDIWDPTPKGIDRDCGR